MSKHYQQSRLLQRLLNRVQAEGYLQLPVDSDQYWLCLTKGAGYQQWVAKVPDRPWLSTISGMQPISQLVHYPILEVVQVDRSNEPHRYHIVGRNK